MAIGKNAIKRVSNNGYSNVKASAPDMENSVVAEPKTEVAEQKPAPKKTTPKTAPKPQAKATPKKPTEKKAQAPKKSLENEPELSPVKTAEKVVKKPSKAKNTSKSFFNIGDELPIYLL